MPHELNIVLVEPEIPMNTGTIGRLCLATQSTLHLIEPLGFEISDSQLKRAGLDYWKHVKVKTHPDLEMKGGNKMRYTSINGHMFTLLTKEGNVGIRLDKEDREAFMEKYNTGLSRQYGAVMKEYVHVPDEMLDDIEALKPYIEKSYEYVQTLKPKSTTKKK